MIMYKNILLAIVLSLTVTACDCKSEKQSIAPVEQKTDTPCGNYMTNEQIVDTINYCKSNGLESEPLHCGDNHQTVTIQCKPVSSSE